MSRYFMLQTWVGSHENEPDYSGQQCGERNVRSIEAVPLYDQFGNANVSAFSDEAIAARTEKKKPKTSIKDRILPQYRRINLLTEQMRELCEEYKNGGMSIEEYTTLLNVLVVKRNRAEELLRKAKSVQPRTCVQPNAFVGENTPKKRASSKAVGYSGNRENVVSSGKKPMNMGVFSSKKVIDLVFRLVGSLWVAAVMVFLSS